MREPRLLERHDDLWVFDKPSGYATHPASDRDIPDLMTWANANLNPPAPLAPVHRLDRDTSGLILFAHDPAVRAQAERWLKARDVHKTYLALVLGTTHAKGTIRRKLKDKRRGKPVEAITRFKRLRAFHKLSYLSVTPETGRKHQIRRHLQGIGHAIVGDERYPPRRFQAVPRFPNRLWLHAHALTLPDGRTFTCPLAEDLAEHLAFFEANPLGPQRAPAPRAEGDDGDSRDAA